MGRMFQEATAFNQDLTGWCVTNINAEPDVFSIESALTNANKPVWGTCPVAKIIEPTVITPPISDDVGSCLVCDKVYQKNYQDGILISTQEFTWEEGLSMYYELNVLDASDELCVGVNFLDLTLNREILEGFKADYEKDGSVCSFQ
jgi:hypothetical protein